MKNPIIKANPTLPVTAAVKDEIPTQPYLKQGRSSISPTLPCAHVSVQVVFTNAHQEPLETVGTEDVTQRKSYMYSDRLGRASAAILKKR